MSLAAAAPEAAAAAAEVAVAVASYGPLAAIGAGFLQ